MQYLNNEFIYRNILKHLAYKNPDNKRYKHGCSKLELAAYGINHTKWNMLEVNYKKKDDDGYSQLNKQFKSARCRHHLVNLLHYIIYTFYNNTSLENEEVECTKW